MMIAMLIAGVGCLLAGLLAIGFGIPVNEFSFGNTLIVSGSIAACAGLIILSLCVAVRELRRIAERLGPGPARDQTSDSAQPAVAAAVHPRSAAAPAGSMLSGEHASDERANAGGSDGYSSAPSRDRPRNEATPPGSPPAVKPRRNLLFSSTSRREREQTRATDLPATEPHLMTAVAPPAEIDDVGPPTFDEASHSERSRSADASFQRRGRTPPTFSDPAAVRPPQAEDAGGQPEVTVLKSGIVDGMAYSLYSNGSIEAQMPEGMMRFASIDELRAYLDQRP